MKSKRLLRLGLLLLVAAALTAAVVIVTTRTAKDGGTDETPDAAQPLVALAADDITAIEYEYAGSPAISFVCDGGSWSCPASPDFPVTQNYLTSIAQGICEVSCYRELGADADPAEYGLDAPRLSVTVGTADGAEYVFAIGNENEHAEGMYLSYGSKIYFADTALADNLWRKSLYDYLTVTDLPELEGVTAVESDGRRVEDEKEVAELVSAYKGMARGDVVDYKNAADYGFDGGEHTAVFYYDVTTDVTDASGKVTGEETGTATYSFRCAFAEDGGEYVMLQDDDLVYLCSGGAALFGAT